LLRELRTKGYDIKSEIIGIQTSGDIDRTTSIDKVEGTDFFTKEIEQALFRGDIDIAVHSAKDLPDNLPTGLSIAAITEGLSSADCLISHNNKNFSELESGTRIGTSSRRRKEEVMRLRSDFRIVDVRGTIGERIALIDKGVIDALIVAEAALIRLGVTHLITEIQSFESSFLQGKLAIEIRENNLRYSGIFSEVDNRKNFGTVFLVGAGPGDPTLITVKGLRLLDRAEVLLYDNLTDKSLVRRSAAHFKICGGKRGCVSSISQGKINSLMLRYAAEGKIVVRLKGGDPCIFGRLWEEVNALKKNFSRTR